MTFNAVTIGRIIRGIIGAAVVAAGILNESWIGLFGVFFIFSAVMGKCGFGAESCEVNPDDGQDKKINERQNTRKSLE